MNRKNRPLTYIKHHRNELLYYGTVLAAMLFFVLLQPLGEPPDESGRYKIVQYICLHGSLPHGADAEIILFGYGGSYGFQPILTYIIQGYLLRFLFQFCQDGYLLLLAARLVNVVFGMIMAVFVRRCAGLLFTDECRSRLFCITVMLLPQSLFMHTYVNTDSMAMMSTAIMLYAWLSGLKKDWDMRSCVTLAIGISLCALSYYNAYGFILCSILLFAASFLQKAKQGGRWQLDWRAMLQKGSFISAIVLLCIGWWFIRNAVLYNGDFLGLRAREECTLLTASARYHPLTKQTWQNQGRSLFDMLFHSDFMELLFNSSVATFGPMSIVTFRHIYTVFKGFFAVCALGLILCAGRAALAAARSRRAHTSAAASCAAHSTQPAAPADSGFFFGPDGYGSFHRRLLTGMMLLCVFIPVLLCVYYSYVSDYQPQGRYILPMLLPFCYFLVTGLRGLTTLVQNILQKKGLSLFAGKLPAAVTLLVTLFYLYALWATLLGIVFPVYYETSILYYIRHMAAG